MIEVLQYIGFIILAAIGAILAAFLLYVATVVVIISIKAIIREVKNGGKDT